MLTSSFTIVMSAAIFFSLIFWLLTFSFKFFYSNKYSSYKFNYYECGFKSITSIHIQYNINFILIIVFILLYEGEFFILIPFVLNSSLWNIYAYGLFLLFILFLLLTLLIDLHLSALDWQI